MEIAAHLRILCGLLTCSVVEEGILGNSGETQFISSVTNCKTLDFVGSVDVK